jgi:hypothetical protein
VGRKLWVIHGLIAIVAPSEKKSRGELLQNRILLVPQPEIARLPSWIVAFVTYSKFLNPAANAPEHRFFGASPEGIRQLVEHIRVPSGAGEAYEVSA